MKMSASQTPKQDGMGFEPVRAGAAPATPDYKFLRDIGKIKKQIILIYSKIPSPRHYLANRPKAARSELYRTRVKCYNQSIVGVLSCDIFLSFFAVGITAKHFSCGMSSFAE